MSDRYILRSFLLSGSSHKYYDSLLRVLKSYNIDVESTDDFDKYELLCQYVDLLLLAMKKDPSVRIDEFEHVRVLKSSIYEYEPEDTQRKKRLHAQRTYADEHGVWSNGELCLASTLFLDTLFDIIKNAKASHSFKKTKHTYWNPDYVATRIRHYAFSLKISEASIDTILYNTLGGVKLDESSVGKFYRVLMQYQQWWTVLIKSVRKITDDIMEIKAITVDTRHTFILSGSPHIAYSVTI